MITHTGLVQGSYSKFDDPADIIPLVKVGVINVAEMWHGPTGAFKDLALSVVGRFVDYFLQKEGKKANVIVGTSGDTGSAAIHSILGSKYVNIVVWYPRKRVSRVQELQMTTVDAPNVKVYSVDGSSDDIDIPFKEIFADHKFVEKHSLVCFNSVNVFRVILQAFHFIFLYLKMCPKVDRDITFCVPSGGLGNLAGGTMARVLGLPVKFVSAVNVNDIVDRAFRLNDFSMADVVENTPSSAMDIQIPYNIERVFYYLCSQDCSTLRGVMESFEREGRCELPPSITGNNTFITTVRVESSTTFSIITKIWKENNYLICPHTAVGMYAALELLDNLKTTSKQDANGCPIVVVATATPAKFPQLISSIGLPKPALVSIDCLFELPEKKELVEKTEDWGQRLREAVESFSCQHPN